MKNSRVRFTCIAVMIRIIAQAQAPEIFIRTFTANDTVFLRWVPADAGTWRAGLKNGYSIERFTTDAFLDLAGQDPAGKGTLLTAAPLRPLPEQDTLWKKLMSVEKRNAFLFDALYGNASTATDPGKRKTEEQLKMGLALKTADLSVTAAKAEGLFFADGTAAAGQSYVYCIRLAGSTGKPAVVAVSGESTVLHAPEKVQAEFRNRKAVISFDAASTRAECAGYVIERSDDSLHFLRVNEVLFVFAVSQWEQQKTEAVYCDSFPLNHKKYFYRVRTFTCFGTYGPPSLVVAGSGKEEWTVFPLIDTLYSPDNKMVQLKWSVTGGTKTIRSCDVLRAPAAGDVYLKLNADPISGAASVFTDQHPLMSGYYVVRAVSSEGDTALSFPYFISLKDEQPPAVPQQLIGKIDTTGVAHLSWNAVADADLKGYRVFRRNAATEEWIEITDTVIAAHAVSDSVNLHTLTTSISYCVRSVDRMYNNSAASAVLTLRRPDRMAPVAPVIKSAYHNDSVVFLAWINSSSDDVREWKLYRESEGVKQQLRIFSPSDTTAHFADKPPVPRKDYTYSLLVTDSSGNSASATFPVIPFYPRIYPALNAVSARVEPKKRMVELSWEAPTGEVDRYVIYRAKKGEQLRIWKTIDGKSASIADRELYPGNVYEYSIKAVMKDGAETRMSGVEVVY